MGTTVTWRSRPFSEASCDPPSSAEVVSLYSDTSRSLEKSRPFLGSARRSEVFLSHCTSLIDDALFICLFMTIRLSLVGRFDGLAPFPFVSARLVPCSSIPRCARRSFATGEGFVDGHFKGMLAVSRAMFASIGQGNPYQHSLLSSPLVLYLATLLDPLARSAHSAHPTHQGNKLNRVLSPNGSAPNTCTNLATSSLVLSARVASTLSWGLMCVGSIVGCLGGRCLTRGRGERLLTRRVD